MMRLSKSVLAAFLAMATVFAASDQLVAEDASFPVAFRFHCGGKARYSIPNAIGFSPESDRLACVYRNRLMLVDVGTGKEVKQIRISQDFNRVDYNYVVFDPTGKYCCVGQLGHEGILLQFFDIKNNVASKVVTLKGIPEHPMHYKSDGYFLPLRQWLAISMSECETEATCEVEFPNEDCRAASKELFHVSVSGDETLQAAEKACSEMKSRTENFRKFWLFFLPKDDDRNGQAVRNSTGYGTQVALSKDHQTLLTQLVKGEVTTFQYQFDFFDATSFQRIVSVSIPTGISWRFNGSRGFAFSPDFRYLARTNPGGLVIVHDLSKVVERRLGDNQSVSLPFRDAGP